MAVIANDALGNYALATLPLQMLRSQHEPATLGLYCGQRIAELARAESELFDQFIPLHGQDLAVSLAEARRYDFVLNLESTPLSKVMAGLLAGDEGWVCGPCVGAQGRGELAYSDDLRGKLWQEKAWARESLPQDYPFLKSGFIGEIFCRLAGLDGPIPPYRIPRQAPPGDVPDVLIAMSASLEDKLWPGSHWAEAASWLQSRGRSVGLIGAKPKAQGQFWHGLEAENGLVQQGLVHDLRGDWTLPEVVGALGSASCVLTLDNGIMHFAASTGTPTVGLFRHGIHWLWAPPLENLQVIPGEPGAPVGSIPVSVVLSALERALAQG